MAEEKKETKKEKKQKEIWELGQVATQVEEVIVNTETDETLTTNQALVKILNTLEGLKKLI